MASAGSARAGDGPAPYFAEIAEGPETGGAVWKTCDDGVRVRIGLWPLDGARGTVLLFPGRTEYIEKYGPVARDLARRGLAAAAIDWRGQGLADRALADRLTGHVHRFPDYQRDVAAMLAAVAEARLPGPLVLVAHSMGGAIGLRAAAAGLPVQALVFSAPMWGIGLSRPVLPVAWALSWAAQSFGFGHRYAPGTGPKAYVGAAEMAGNVLTSDPVAFSLLERQLAAHPELALGGPSLGWLHQALRETRALARIPSPALPCYTALGTNERVVDPAAVRARIAAWPGAELDPMEGGEHEILMERPELRERFLDRVAGFV